MDLTVVMGTCDIRSLTPKYRMLTSRRSEVVTGGCCNKGLLRLRDMYCKSIGNCKLQHLLAKLSHREIGRTPWVTKLQQRPKLDEPKYIRAVGIDEVLMFRHR